MNKVKVKDLGACGWYESLAECAGTVELESAG
jgi:hypothetical protein